MEPRCLLCVLLIAAVQAQQAYYVWGPTQVDPEAVVPFGYPNVHVSVTYHCLVQRFMGYEKGRQKWYCVCSQRPSYQYDRCYHYMNNQNNNYWSYNYDPNYYNYWRK